MLKHISAITLFTLTSLGLSPQASATLILEQYASGAQTPNTLGGYEMTDFAITNGAGGTTTSISSPINGSLDFTDRNGIAANMSRDLANSADWWINGESSDYDIFTTDKHLITLILPEDTVAFSFNVGADVGGSGNNAWLTATETDGSGIDSKHWFNVNRTNTPGFGLYTDNNQGSCSTISSVTIDPLLWGFGNFSINQGGCAASVPAPSAIALLSLGLLGLGALQRKNKT